ncbi:MULTISPECIES: ABC transporter ATP-binding protein [Sutcliffiella]|uniref:Spermidine/putrescine ABC transporter ATP-binding protein n=1 Tax=Sutcliffiella cohnii TaxID=33932 RepID=A0A223KQ34_9BACI|nr:MULTISPECIES: ABC transporter ATP-binding protein [Sutcliffiella]AST91464.1 spermidine/putrescine ABC transporter ATP-binding protein [Sutcliffiella cohnii]MED4014973.1 ABC transporter ATP-binding protein [Sutcliffiella cohnii]WBL17293.1 ABC transporter ATP-binding protein [Sutcliffiella sp. NC1]
MIKFESVTKQYGKDIALGQTSIIFEKGKITGLLGPNGSGKSTSLKMMAGLVKPTKGFVTVDGEKVDRTIAKKVAYLTELDFYYEPFTVQNMIDFYASQFTDFQNDKAEKLLQFMKLDKSKKLKHLSKGNRGRLKLVLALARNAEYVLMDEPFSGLDPMVRNSIVKGLLTYVDFGKQTIIIATHEIDEIEPLLDDVVLIKNGNFLAKQNVEQLRENQQLSVKDWMIQQFDE